MFYFCNRHKCHKSPRVNATDTPNTFETPPSTTRKFLARQAMYDMHYARLVSDYANARADAGTNAYLLRFDAVSRRSTRYGTCYRVVTAEVQSNIVPIAAKDSRAAQTWAYFHAEDPTSCDTLEAGLLLLRALGPDKLKQTYELFMSADAKMQKDEGYESSEDGTSSPSSYVSRDSAFYDSEDELITAARSSAGPCSRWHARPDSQATHTLGVRYGTLPEPSRRAMAI